MLLAPKSAKRWNWNQCWHEEKTPPSPPNKLAMRRHRFILSASLSEISHSIACSCRPRWNWNRIIKNRNPLNYHWRQEKFFDRQYSKCQWQQCPMHKNYQTLYASHTHTHTLPICGPFEMCSLLKLMIFMTNIDHRPPNLVIWAGMYTISMKTCPWRISAMKGHRCNATVWPRCQQPISDHCLMNSYKNHPVWREKRKSIRLFDILPQLIASRTSLVRIRTTKTISMRAMSCHADET